MPGILDIFGNMSPQQSQGLLAAAAQILQRSGPSRQPFTIGQAMGTGIEAYQGSIQDQQQRAMQEQFRAQQLEDGQMDLQDKKRAREMQQQIDAAARRSMRSPGQQAAALPGGPTVANAERIGEFEGGFDAEAFIQQVMAIDPMQGLKLAQSMKKAGPKYDTKPQTAIGEDGKPFQYIVAENGEIKRLDGVLPRDEMKVMNLNDREVAYNPYALTPGQTFQRGVSPDTRASNAVSMRGQDITARGQNMVDARQRQAMSMQQQFARAPTEFQGKSAAFGLRATEADKTIAGLTGQYSPAAINSKTNVENWPLVGGALGALTNKFALGANDQKAEQAQRDFVNAVLRQESGAAIGADEFDNARKQYFPQPGDGPGVIAQKARNRQLAIQGFQSNAGRAAMTAPAAPSGTPGDITDLLNKYGGN